MTFCPEMKAGTLILCSLLGDFLYNGKGFLTSNFSRQTSRIFSTSSAKSIACCWSFLFIGIPWPSPTAWTMLGFNLYFGRGYRKCTSSGGFLPSRSDTMKRWIPSPERFLISTRQPTSHCSTSSKSAPSLILRSQNSWNLSPSSTSVKEFFSSNSASVDDVEHLSGFMTSWRKCAKAEATRATRATNLSLSPADGQTLQFIFSPGVKRKAAGGSSYQLSARKLQHVGTPKTH